MYIFIQNKYTRWYSSLIEKRQNEIPDGYKENHHIIPKCMGGQDTNDNLVFLTAREHIVAHWLLTKMTSGANQRKMYHAFANMLRISENQERKVTILEVAKCREARSKARKGESPFSTEESKQRWVEAMKEVNARPEVKAKRSKSQKKAQNRQETIEKRRKTNSIPEYKERQSKASKESQNRPEVKAQKSKRLKELWRTPEGRERGKHAAKECQNRPEVKAKKSKILRESIRTCPHCNKTGVGPAMFRFHFSRCKTLNHLTPTGL